MGMTRWLCEFGRVDLLHEASLLSTYMAQPRNGHLQQALNMFFYLKHNVTTGWLIYDPYDYDISWNPCRPNKVPPHERAEAMKILYSESIEAIPHNMPTPRGKAVNINISVDLDHVGNKVTRRSHTGIMMFINMAPIQWFSKRQNTVEVSTFGAEFIVLKIATHMNDALRYKLRKMGVHLKVASRVMCDNQSVFISDSFPESTLKKKNCSIAYHRVRECIAGSKVLLYFERTGSNIADLFTKILTANKRHPLIRTILS